MREILFRGKQEDNEKWVIGYLSSKHTITIQTPCGHMDEIVICADTVGQFTGLTDKNGKRIFEGDILLLDDIKGIVNYGTGCFCVKLSYLDYLYRHNPAIDIVLNEYPGLEVIGNITDNPELMEK